MSPWKELFLATIIAIGSGIFLIEQAPKHAAHLINKRTPYSAPPLTELDSTTIALLTLGHKNLYENFINIWLLQSLMQKSHDPSRVEDLLAAIRAVTKHRPKFETLYMLSCFVMYQDFNKPEYCQEFILAGLDVFPQSWRLPVTQAYIHAFLLDEPAQAASFFMMAGSRPQAPDWTKRVAQKLISSKALDEEDLRRSREIIAGEPGASEFFNSLSRIQAR